MRTKSWIPLPVALSFVLCICFTVVAQEAPPTDHSKRVWTNEDLARLTSLPVTNALEASSLDNSTPRSIRESYSRVKDPKWYAGQLRPLREELAKIDSELIALRQARKYGKGATDAVALDQEPAGVTSEGQVEVLQKRRAQMLRQIDELEEQARHNAIVPGELRVEPGPEETAPADSVNAESSAANGNERKSSREAGELTDSLAEEKEHLGHIRKEAELLQRNLVLAKQQEYSNPEPPSRRNNQPELVRITGRLAGKQAEIQETEQKIAHLEDRLEDLKRNPPAGSMTEASVSTGNESGNDSAENDRAKDERDEASWRKRFAAIDYKIRIARTELDILQREHNLGLVQYYPNPATAMKESITRRAINARRKAIEEKKKEIVELAKARADLEDELRHAGAPAGWARE